MTDQTVMCVGGGADVEARVNEQQLQVAWSRALP